MLEVEILVTPLDVVGRQSEEGAVLAVPEVDFLVLPLDMVDRHLEEGEVLDAYGYTGEAPVVFRWILGWAGRSFCGVAGWGRSVVFFGNLLQGFLVRHITPCVYAGGIVT